jgi:hypothetical protein
MRTMTRVLNNLACLANDHPQAVLALTLAVIVAVVGLAVFGAISLFTPPILPKLFFGAAVALAALVVIQRNFTKG